LSNYNFLTFGSQLTTRSIMARVLTGIQSTGKPHLGNLLGAIQPAIELSQNSNHEAFFFIANMHSITAIKDGNELKSNTLAVAAAWLAFGLDTDKHTFYRQSDIPEVCELMWYLSCFTPIPMLENAHSYKDKSEKLSKDKINTGLFAYPVLMAADILLYQAELVPVGKDQKQHLEITRDIASSFNYKFGQDVFVLPESQIKEEVMTVPGIDGQKMSKSYNNYIDIFQSDKDLKKNINKIVTDSTPLEEPKVAETCNVFKIYSLLATPEQIATMKANYEAGNYGFGHAKTDLLNLIIEKYATERALYNEYINNPNLVEEKLQAGATKARKIASVTLAKVREVLGV
jgi:tryptophanyl-tRNA synthetase